MSAMVSHADSFSTARLTLSLVAPPELLQKGIYSEIAVALKGGAWRNASMALLTVALIIKEREDQSERVQESGDPFASLSNGSSLLGRLGMRRATKATGAQLGRPWMRRATNSVFMHRLSRF